MFLQYLWGIETKLVVRNWNIGHLFLQYLWGIETCSSSSCCGFFHICFYSTYEELKLYTVADTLLLTFGFYSTYEELKLSSNSSMCSSVNSFLQYLWGIETEVGSISILSSRKVFTVPMRNWNIINEYATRPFLVGFYSTYEELKLASAMGI